jgi:predicted transcriptional regulator
MKAVVIGILPQEKIRERVLSIARSEYKPKPSDPKIWFTSMRSLAEVLSDENRELLKVIQKAKPQSISSLADLTGRKTSNLSRSGLDHNSARGAQSAQHMRDTAGAVSRGPGGAGL